MLAHESKIAQVAFAVVVQVAAGIVSGSAEVLVVRQPKHTEIRKVHCTVSIEVRADDLYSLTGHVDATRKIYKGLARGWPGRCRRSGLSAAGYTADDGRVTIFVRKERGAEWS